MISFRTALVALSIALAGPVAAQDFTSMDLTALNNQLWSGMSSDMNGMVNNIVTENVANPQVQAMYWQAVRQGYTGTIQQYAYLYAENGGFTPGGIANNFRVTNEINNKNAKMNADYFAHGNVYRDAYSNYTNGFSNNLNELGLGLTGKSTYEGQFGSQVLPHVWDTNSYHNYGGNDYYVDYSGQYWMADPNASGMWYGLY